MTTTTHASGTPTYRAQTDPTTKKWHLGSAERGPLSFCGVRLIVTDDTRAFALKVPEADRHIETSDDLTRVDCGACRRNREWAYANGAERPTPHTGGRRRASTPSRRRGATGDPRADRADEPGTGLPDYQAAQLLVDGIEARNRRTTVGTRPGGARPTGNGIDREGNGHTTPRQERAELDARVTALLATLPADAEPRTAADLREALSPAPLLPALKASLKRLGYTPKPERRKSARERAAERSQAAHAASQAADAAVAGIDAALAAAGADPCPAEAAANPAPVPTASLPRAERPMSRAAKVRALVDSGECPNAKAAREYLADMGE